MKSNRFSAWLLQMHHLILYGVRLFPDDFKVLYDLLPQPLMYTGVAVWIPYDELVLAARDAGIEREQLNKILDKLVQNKLVLRRDETYASPPTSHRFLPNIEYATNI